MKYIIDRFEGEFAVVELGDRTFVNIPRKAVPPDAREGSVIDARIDEECTSDRSRKINNMMNDLFT